MVRFESARVTNGLMRSVFESSHVITQAEDNDAGCQKKISPRSQLRTKLREAGLGGSNSAKGYPLSGARTRSQSQLYHSYCTVDPAVGPLALDSWPKTGLAYALWC